MYVAMLFEKLRPIKEYDAIFFYKFEKQKKKLFDECLDLYITLMIDWWEIKITSIDNGLVINICSHNFLIQLKEKGI